MIEFEVRVWNKDGEFVNSYAMGRNSLGIELDHLPVGWKVEVVRTAFPVTGETIMNALDKAIAERGE